MNKRNLEIFGLQESKIIRVAGSIIGLLLALLILWFIFFSYGRSQEDALEPAQPIERETTPSAEQQPYPESPTEEVIEEQKSTRDWSSIDIYSVLTYNMTESCKTDYQSTRRTAVDARTRYNQVKEKVDKLRREVERLEGEFASAEGELENYEGNVRSVLDQCLP